MIEIVIHCDGGCRGNGKAENLGGWGVMLEFGDQKKELRGAECNTTNQRMELTACIKALEAVKRTDIPVRVVSDSAYLVNGMNSWTYAWARNGWMTSLRKPVLNAELWRRLVDLRSGFRKIEFSQCKGHAGNEGNNRADALANQAMDEISQK